MRNTNGSLTVAGRLFVVGMGVVVLNLVGLVAIDCIVASAMTPPPDRCADIIAQLRDDGILRPPPAITEP